MGKAYDRIVVPGCSTAEQIIYGALERIGEKTGKPPAREDRRADRTPLTHAAKGQRIGSGMRGGHQ
jgi:hypothetical protein